MPTYRVTCVECGGEKWPMLAERPAVYRCQLCEQLRASGRKGAASRWGKGRQRSQDSRG